MRRKHSILIFPLLMVSFVILSACAPLANLQYRLANTEKAYAYLEFWPTNTDSKGITFTTSGEQFAITYHLKPVDAQIEWSSSDTAVADVDENGVVTAVGPGTCEITAHVGLVTDDGQQSESYVDQSFSVSCNFESVYSPGP